MLEMGRMTLDEYLRTAVFTRPRPFSLAEFKACMLAQSAPFQDDDRPGARARAQRALSA